MTQLTLTTSSGEMISPFTLAGVFVNDPGNPGGPAVTGTLTAQLSGGGEIFVGSTSCGSTMSENFLVASEVPGSLEANAELAQVQVQAPTVPAGTEQSLTLAFQAQGTGAPGIDTACTITIDVEGPPPEAAPATVPITPTTVALPPALLVPGDPSSPSAQISRLYYAALDRGPDPQGLAGWTSQLSSGTPLAVIAAGFTNSPEFLADYGPAGQSPANFVTELYSNVLGRSPDAVGFANWTNAMGAGGLTAPQVLVGFSNSPEFINKIG